MRQVEIRITGVTPYSASKKLDVDEHPLVDDKEKPDDYDIRLWRHKCTFNGQKIVCIPSMAFKMAVDEAVKRLNIKIPGRGKSTYAKYFVAGQICEEDMSIGVHFDKLNEITIWANSDGVRGSGKRVKRRFPYIQEWAGTVRFSILDELIPNIVFEKAIVEAGRLVGVGRFRPEKGGFLGRFKADGFKWSTV